MFIEKRGKLNTKALMAHSVAASPAWLPCELLNIRKKTLPGLSGGSGRNLTGTMTENTAPKICVWEPKQSVYVFKVFLRILYKIYNGQEPRSPENSNAQCTMHGGFILPVWGVMEVWGLAFRILGCWVFPCRDNKKMWDKDYLSLAQAYWLTGKDLCICFSTKSYWILTKVLPDMYVLDIFSWKIRGQ